MSRLLPVGADPHRRGGGGRRRGGHRRGRLRRRRLPPGGRGGARPDHTARPGGRRHRRQDRRQPAGGQEPGRAPSGSRPPCCATPRPSPPSRPASTGAAWARWPSTPSSAWRACGICPSRRRWRRASLARPQWWPRTSGRRGRRALLNYGHTLAHALETAGRYDLRHGEAVAIGLVFAARLARRLGRIDDDRVAEHEPAGLGSYDLPIAAAAGGRPRRAGHGHGPGQEGHQAAA